MVAKFPGHSAPLSEMKTDPGRIVRHVEKEHRPVLLTDRGRGVAVIQAVGDYEAVREERSFMRAAVAGLADLQAGRDASLAEVKAKFGLDRDRMSKH